MSLIENKSQRLLDEQIRKAIAVASSQVSVKATDLTFDPNAVDGDGDGLVQDGSPFERPAVISALTNTAQRLGNILSRATRVTTQGRHSEYQRRYSGMSAKDIAETAVPATFEDWVALTYERLRVDKPELPALTADTTPRQRAEIVRALEDFVESDLVWMLSVEKAKEFKELKKTDRNAAFRMLLDGAFDFSPKAVAKNRRLVEHVLTTNPQFRELVNKFGMPPIVKFGDNMDSSHMAKGFYSSELGIALQGFRNVKSQGLAEPLGRRIGQWFMEATMPNDVGSKRTKRWLTRSTPESLLVHEYGHYLADAIGKTMPEDEKYGQKGDRWKAWRFAVGSQWKQTFSEMGKPEWFDEYMLIDEKTGERFDPLRPGVRKMKRRDVSDEIPHVETAYGESAPAEAFAETIAALFAHDGKDKDLVSDGMEKLVADLLGLDRDKDIREQFTPARITRQVVPDGFASRGQVAVINEERDAKFGEITDPYEIGVQALGNELSDDTPFGNEIRTLESWLEEHGDKPRMENTAKWVRSVTNITEASEEDAAFVVQVLLDNPGLVDMIRRHGVAPIYFSESDLNLSGMEVRGVHFGFGIPDSEAEVINTPRVVMDLHDATPWKGTPDVPTPPLSREKMKEWRKVTVFDNVTRTHVGNSNEAVLRHEIGHSIHDRLLERAMRGEITGRRAQLIRAYASDTWEEFYKELGRPDLWEEHQRALRATHILGYPGETKPSEELPWVDSAYAYTNPREMFAEVFTAYTSSDPAFRSLIGDVALEHMQAMSGDSDTIPEPPPLLDAESPDFPEPPPMDGFASTGSRRAYPELREERLREGKGTFSRAELFRNTTTEEKVNLAVPENETEHALMAWDQMFERMSLTYDEIGKIDLTDPYNPKLPRRWREAADSLELYASLLQRDKPNFDPEVVRSNREALRATLDAFPRMREVAERMGLPPLTTMSEDTRQRVAQEAMMRQAYDMFRTGRDVNPAILDAMPAFMDYYAGTETWDEFLDRPETQAFQDYIQQLADEGTWEKWASTIQGGYSPANETFLMPRSYNEKFDRGSRVDLAFEPSAGSWGMTDESYEGILLHEYGHFIHRRLESRAKRGDKEANRLVKEHQKLFESVDQNIQTEYGRTLPSEFAAEALAAVLSGNKRAEELLSPDARRWVRETAGLPERDPVFAGRTQVPKPKPVTLVDRFGSRWNKTPEGTWTNVDNAKRNRSGVPDVLETMAEAKQRTGLTAFEPVEFEHEGRRFTMTQFGDTFQVDVNGRTVATAQVVEGADGLPEINSVDVLPGYDGIAPDNDLHEMVVDHARKRYPSARAPQRARKADVKTEGFASKGGPETHVDLRDVEGEPGSPEYQENMAVKLQQAMDEGKRVQFMYNDELRDVEITKLEKGKNGVWYVTGLDSTRNGEERNFRVDRVAKPKIVKNPESGKEEAIKPGKRPRRPVPVFTGKAAEIFEGASSWEEVAERLGKGRYVFFDFETTGIENDEMGGMAHPGTPTQLGLVEIIDGKVTRRWSTHINPGRPLSIDPKTGRSWSADNLKYRDPETGELVNISDEWLATQMPLKDALEEMLDFIGPIEDTILGAQNHPYDDEVMRRAMADAGIDAGRWNPAGFIDSQALAQATLDSKTDDYPTDENGRKTVSLGHLARFVGHDMGDGWHSADADAEASWEAFSRLVRRAADREAAGEPVPRDLIDGRATQEYAERLASYDRQLKAWTYKRQKQMEAEKAAEAAKAADKPASPDGFASRGAAPKRKASNPSRWAQLTPEEREAATQASAEAAINYLNALADAGIDVNALRDLDRAELDAILKDLVPGGEARVSDYVTGDGKPLIEVSNATMGQVFMSLGFHVEVISDDPDEKHLLENGINDMQAALQNYVKAVAKDPDALKRDAVFRAWAEQEGIDIAGLDDKKLEKAAKKFAEQFEINLCLYYKSGSNMLCGENIGIEREEMPQLGGRMKGDDTLAARAIKAGLLTAKEIKLNPEKMAELEKRDPAMAARVRELANAKGKIVSEENLKKVAELAKTKDPLAKAVFDSMDWNDSEATIEAVADQAAAALGIAIDTPRFVDPETMLGAQNQLQGSKVENMADGAVNAVLKALPILESRLGRKPTQEELMEYLRTEIPMDEGGGLFQPTLTAGHPGSQIYMLDGHHRWSGLLMANKKLEAMGLDVRVQLNIKNYQTDIRSGLELGRVIQVALGVKDAKLAGEDPFKFDANVPELTPDEFDKIVKEIADPANLKKKLQEVREGGKFRETEGFDAPGGQKDRLQPRKRPIRDVIEQLMVDDPAAPPKSRVAGTKPQSTGYRAAGTGMSWQSVEDHVALERERGNELFDTHQEYLDKGYEAAWVTHTPGDAGRYVVSAGEVDAWQAGEVEVNPADVAEVDLTGATLVGKDDEGGFLYVRKKPTSSTRRRRRVIDQEEQLLNVFEGSTSGLASRGGYPEGWRPGPRPGYPIDVKPFEFDKETMDNLVIDSIVERADEVLNTQGLSFTMDERDIKEVEAAIKRLEGMGERGKKKAAKLRRDLERKKKNDERWRERFSREMEDFEPPKPYVRMPGDEMKPLRSDGFASTGSVFADDALFTLVDPKVDDPAIYEEDVRLAGRKYKFKVTDDGMVFVFRRKKNIGYIHLDLGHSKINGTRTVDPTRHHIRMVHVDEKHRRRGIATEMARIAEHVHGGRVEHSAVLSKEGRAWRDADMERRGAPGAKPIKDIFDDADGDEFSIPLDQVAFSDAGLASTGRRRIRETRSADGRVVTQEFETTPDTRTPEQLEQDRRAQEAMAERVRFYEEADRENYGDDDDDGFASRGPEVDKKRLQKVRDRAASTRENARQKQTERKMQLTPLQIEMAQRLATGDATVLERLGLTPEQVRQAIEAAALVVNDHVDKYLSDKKTRDIVKHGLTLLSYVGKLWLDKKLGGVAAAAGKATSGYGGTSPLEAFNTFIGQGIYDALVTHGEYYAKLIATELAAMGVLTRQKAKEMVDEIKARMEKTGEYIGAMSREAWNRLRGAWSKIRPTAPIPAASGAKQWIVAGSSPIWAELSWSDYQAKSRITRTLQPSDTRQWAQLAVKAGNSPELIDIAAYRAGIGYGRRRVKPRDVVRVYL